MGEAFKMTKIKSAVLFLLIVIIVICVGVLSYKAGVVKNRAELLRSKGEIAIYRDQAENYARVIRNIRETAANATVTEKAK